MPVGLLSDRRHEKYSDAILVCVSRDRSSIALGCWLRVRIEVGDRPQIVACDAALSRMTTKELA